MRLSLLPIFAIACAVLIGEVAARVYHRVTYAVPLTATLRTRSDDILGWEGKKLFGDPRARKFKILVLGDSMTHGLGVPDDRLYAAVLGRALGAEIFMYAGSGYGTRQEALAMEQALNTVSPDLVLLQVCANDFINNSWPLELASYLNNNLTERPYLVGDRIEYHFPSRFGETRLVLARHSRFFYEVLVALDRVGADLARRGYLHGVELDIYRHGLAFPPFAESVATTERIIARMRARLDGVPLVAVATDDYPVPWPEIFRRQGVPYIEDAVRSVEAEEAKGAKLRLTDGRHWNAEGHEIVGRSLAGWISLFLASRK